MAFNNNPGKQSFTATGGQTEFDFNFKIYANVDLKVYLTPEGQDPDDTTDLLTLTTDYTVVIDGDDGGTVTLTSGATLNDTIVIARDLDATRDISYVTNGDLKAATLNLDQDYQTYLIIDGYVALANAVQLPQSAVNVDPVLPNVVGDAYLKWNAAGTQLENDTTIPQAVIDAAASAAAALVSENAAAASALAASTSETNAATSETNAANSASAASTSETNAATSETNTEALYDAFDDTYLGAKASDPTLDNDGDALITGALYFNTTSNVMKVYNGSTWDAIDTLTIASTAEAQSGTDNTKAISPLRLREGLNASGAQPIYAARAWVNFNGTGTVAIRSSGNVSSITDLGTGQYRVNFTTAMPDTGYSAVIGAGNDTSGSGTYSYIGDFSTDLRTASSFKIVSLTNNGATFQDSQFVSAVVFR